MFIGLLIAIIVAVYLFKNLGILTQGVWSVVWLLTLIAFWLYLMYKNYHMRVWRKLE